MHMTNQGEVTKQRRTTRNRKEQNEVHNDEGKRSWVKVMRTWRKRGKERSGFLFPNSGFLDNDWAVMVLSLSSPNETRGRPAQWCLFLSIFHLFLFFSSIVTHTHTQIIHTESAFHLNCSPLYCFPPLFFIRYHLFLHTQQKPLVPKPGFVAC